MRQVATYEIEILIDPWFEEAAIWRLNLQTLQKTKIRDFNDYRELPYQDHVKW